MRKGGTENPTSMAVSLERWLVSFFPSIDMGICHFHLVDLGTSLKLVIVFFKEVFEQLRLCNLLLTVGPCMPLCSNSCTQFQRQPSPQALRFRSCAGVMLIYQLTLHRFRHGCTPQEVTRASRWELLSFTLMCSLYQSGKPID